MGERNHRVIVCFVSMAFFLSGGCGLVYEVLWTRYLADLMGATSLSQFVVLMVFMGGLALGAILIGRLVDRERNGLLYYGWLEVGIGLYAVLFPFLFSKVAGVFIYIGTNFEPGSLSLLALKLLIASLLIAMPSVAMGGTLPAVTRYLTRSQTGLRGNISLLYGLNSLGAVLGVLLGGFFLVYRYGLSGSMISVGVINICLGFVAVAGARFFARNKEITTEEGSSRHSRVGERLDTHIYKSYTARRAIVIAGLSGLAAMALQVAWIRYFVIVLGATHGAFTIVVAAFILGLGLGALLVRTRWIGRFPLATVLATIFALISTTIGLGLFFYGRLPFEIGRFLAIIARTPFAWPFHEIMKFGICFTLMLLPTVASGMILPICVRIANRGAARVGRDVALVYGFNTLGSLLGIFIASQLLFRMLTLPRTLQLIMLIYLATTFFLAFILKDKGRKRILALTVVLMMTHFVFWQPWSPVQFIVERIDFGQIPPVEYEDFVRENRGYKVVEDRQGPDVQATVLDISSSPEDVYRALLINGKPDASNDINGPDMVTQVLLGHLPMLLHPAPKNVFVLGLGSGITSAEILKFPEVEKVVTVELAAEVFEASKNFAADNGRFWENPKHRMVIDDGKTFLRLSKEKFDVISMEPTNIWQKGMAGLFSEEFFGLVKSRLSPGGVVVQWLHTYKIDNSTFNIILKTFSQVFPGASIFEVGTGDVLLVGYGEQWQLDPQNLEQRFYQPQILAVQKQVGDVNPAALLLREVLGRESFRAYTSAVAAPVNNDNFPVLERAAEYGHFIKQPVTILAELDSRLDPDGGELLIHDYLRQFGFAPASLRAVIDSGLFRNNNKLNQSLNFMLLNKLWPSTQAVPPQTARPYVNDPQMREIIMHPYYRTPPDNMDSHDAYNLLGAELLIWGKIASRLWTPDRARLHLFYDRAVVGADQLTAGRLARDVALSLARGRACAAARPFLRIAGEKGGLSPEMMSSADIGLVFSCEVNGGDPKKADQWWKVIEEENIQQTIAMKVDRATLDIKLGGQPVPVYRRLPPK